MNCELASRCRTHRDRLWATTSWTPNAAPAGCCASSSTTRPCRAATRNGEFITVDDCEKVTRQLQHVLEVEGCAYARLEVSSPGLDRPLKKAADYERFAGEQVDLTLKLPFQGRKKYRGVLAGAATARRRLARSSSTTARRDQALDFSLDEVREARLVPVVDFKGRRFAPRGARRRRPRPDEVDGGRKQ